MILEKMRTVFLEINRTQEQDLLIGSSCLALTDKERELLNEDKRQFDEKSKIEMNKIETKNTSSK